MTTSIYHRPSRAIHNLEGSPIFTKLGVPWTFDIFFFRLVHINFKTHSLLEITEAIEHCTKVFHDFSHAAV